MEGSNAASVELGASALTVARKAIVKTCMGLTAVYRHLLMTAYSSSSKELRNDTVLLIALLCREFSFVEHFIKTGFV